MSNLNFVNFLFLTFLFFACAPEQPSKQDSTALPQVENEKKEYYSKIELSVIKEGSRKVKINITTDFPDGVNFLVDVGRKHYLKGKSEVYFGEIFSEDLTVKNGEIETTIIIDDTNWYNKYQELRKSLPNDWPPISKISDKIDVKVLFSPRRTQSPDILKLLGTKGEFVKGDSARKHEFLDFMMYKTSKKINIPFKK